MDLAELQRKVIATARANPPSDRVPYAFEKRILARLAGRPEVDHWTPWSRALWRAAISCVALMLLLGAWSYYTPTGSRPSSDLAQEFENTVFAAADQEATVDTTW